MRGDCIAGYVIGRLNDAATSRPAATAATAADDDAAVDASQRTASMTARRRPHLRRYSDSARMR